jgi:hypothetical protein
MKRHLGSIFNSTPSPFKSGILGSINNKTPLDDAALANKQKLEHVAKSGVVGNTITKEELELYGQKHNKEFEDSQKFSSY